MWAYTTTYAISGSRLSCTHEVKPQYVYCQSTQTKIETDAPACSVLSNTRNDILNVGTRRDAKVHNRAPEHVSVPPLLSYILLHYIALQVQKQLESC